MPTVVRIDPRLKGYAHFGEQARDRIAAMAEEAGDPDAKKMADAAIARLWAGDPALCLIGIVDETTLDLVGHVLAAASYDGGPQPVVQVTQFRADQNVGDALLTALEQGLEWGRALHPKLLTVSSKRDGKELMKRLGLKHYRYILRVPLNGEAHAHAAPGDTADRGAGQ